MHKKINLGYFITELLKVDVICKIWRNLDSCQNLNLSTSWYDGTLTCVRLIWLLKYVTMQVIMVDEITGRVVTDRKKIN